MRRPPVVPFLVLASVACGAPAPRPGCPDTAWLDSLVVAHLARYPALEPADAFKLLQQATLGSEHAVTDAAGAADWLRREWAALGEGPAEPLVDTLGRGGRFARVHLRPWRAAGGTPGPLAAAFVATAREAPADTALLRCAVHDLAGLARAGRLPWPADSVRALAAAWEARRFPAVHHGAAYAERYRPAYRVVAVRLVPGLLADTARP